MNEKAKRTKALKNLDYDALTLLAETHSSLQWLSDSIPYLVKARKQDPNRGFVATTGLAVGIAQSGSNRGILSGLLKLVTHCDLGSEKLVYDRIATMIYHTLEQFGPAPKSEDITVTNYPLFHLQGWQTKLIAEVVPDWSPPTKGIIPLSDAVERASAITERLGVIIVLTSAQKSLPSATNERIRVKFLACGCEDKKRKANSVFASLRSERLSCKKHGGIAESLPEKLTFEAATCFAWDTSEVIIEKQVYLDGLDRSPFDWGVIKDGEIVGLCEADGEPHYEPWNTGEDAMKAFQAKQLADLAKTSRANELKIPLLRLDTRKQTELTNEQREAIKKLVSGQLSGITQIGETVPGILKMQTGV